jgi:hypothetical protein
MGEKFGCSAVHRMAGKWKASGAEARVYPALTADINVCSTHLSLAVNFYSTIPTIREYT